MIVELDLFRLVGLVLVWAFAVDFHFEICLLALPSILQFIWLIVALTFLPSTIQLSTSSLDQMIFDWIGPLWKPPRKPLDPLPFQISSPHQVQIWLIVE